MEVLVLYHWACALCHGEIVLSWKFFSRNSFQNTYFLSFPWYMLLHQNNQHSIFWMWILLWIDIFFNRSTSEYARNFSLSGGSQSNIYFNWRTRTKICIGIARGLAFLHEEVRPHIVHRDIKASNILLDKDLTPRISDFGLAKLIPSNVTHVSTRVAGTM